MSSTIRNRPGAAATATGALKHYQLDTDNTCEPYITSIDLQRQRHLRNRFGVSDTRSALIAALVFGEVKR